VPLGRATPGGQPLKPGSMGKPIPGYGIDLVNQDGTPTADGDTGEIVIHTAGREHFCGLFLGYYQDKERTEAVWHDGLYHTGDLAWRDEDGFYWYVGRADDVIKSSGYRIGPFEIENVIMELRGGPISTGVIGGWRLILLPLAGLVTYLPLFLYSAGIRTTSMSLSGILMYINPTLQLLCGILLYDETMSPAMTVAFVCVWLATIVFVAGGEIARRKAATRCSNNG